MTSCRRLPILRELEPTVERLLDRHLETAKEWFPHEFVPVRPRPRLRAGRGVERRRRRSRRRRDRRRRAQRALRQSAHRGQPALLLPLDRADVRARRRVGHLGSTVDRRGRPPLDGDLRLPHRQPGDRSVRARAGPDGAGVEGGDTRPGVGVRGIHLPHACRSWRRASPTATPARGSTTGAGTR